MVPCRFDEVLNLKDCWNLSIHAVRSRETGMDHVRGHRLDVAIAAKAACESLAYLDLAVHKTNLPSFLSLETC